MVTILKKPVVARAVEETYRAGKAYIFNHEGEHLHTLQAPKAESNALFGWNVKVSGNSVVVGEYHSSIEPMKYEGKVYVFNIDGELLQTLTASDPTPRGAFGYSIDLEGDMLAVSEAWAEVKGNSNCGRVYLYKFGAPLESEDPFEKEIPVSDDESEPTGGSIPGYPMVSMALGVAFVILFSRARITTDQSRARQHFSPH